MKFEKISDNKIKVTLSADDLEEWNVNMDNLSSNSPEAQRLFWNMMKRAEAEAGFYVDDSQVIIEAMPLHSEGFVITVTRVDENNDFESIHKYIKNRFRRSELRVKKKAKKISSSLLIYMFHSFDDVCAAAIRFHGIYTGESTLYKYVDYYYLVLTRNCTIDNYPLETMDIILEEYGHKLSHASIQEGFLNEHAQIIMENQAIQTLCKYFSK